MTMAAGYMAGLFDGGPGAITRKRLRKSDDEARKLVEKMRSTIRDHATGAIDDYKIIKVEKIDNNNLWRRYRRRMDQIKAENNGDANERWLFHGTNMAETILQTGFDVGQASPHGMFGPGLYFAWSSSKANQYVFGGTDGRCQLHNDPVCPSCERTMLSCKVCLGKVKEEDGAVRRTQPPSGFHSVKGQRGESLRYSEFVVYDDDQACPRFLVTYKVIPK